MVSKHVRLTKSINRLMFASMGILLLSNFNSCFPVTAVLELLEMNNFTIPSPLIVKSLNDNQCLLRSCRGNRLVIYYHPFLDSVVDGSVLTTAYSSIGDWCEFQKIWRKASRFESMKVSSSFEHLCWLPLGHHIQIHFGCTVSSSTSLLFSKLLSTVQTIHPLVWTSLHSALDTHLCPDIVISAHRLFSENSIGGRLTSW